MYLLAYFLCSLCVSVAFVWYMHMGGHMEGGGHLLSYLSLFSAFPWHRPLTEPGVRLHPLNPSDPPASALCMHPHPHSLHPSTHSTGVKPGFLCNCWYLSSGLLAQVASKYSALQQHLSKEAQENCLLHKKTASNGGSKNDLVHEKAAEGRIVTVLGRF